MSVGAALNESFATRRSIIIHCERYSKYWSGSELKPTE